MEKEGLTVVVVVAYYHFLDQAVLAQLAPDVLVEGVEVHLHLLRAHLVLGVVGRVLVEVGEEDGLRVRRLHVFARAAIAMAAGADLVVETAIDLRVEMSVRDVKAAGGAVVPCPARCQRWRRDSWPCCRYAWSRVVSISRFSL